MRELRFRAWEKENEESRKQNPDFHGAMHKITSYHLNSFFDYCLDRPQDYDMMQFIGVLDRNNIAIFEKDIIKFLHFQRVYFGVVEYHETSYKLVTNSGWKCDFGAVDGTFGWEVVGNVYENSELIEQNYEL